LDVLNSPHAQQIHAAFANIIKSQQHLRKVILNYKSGFRTELHGIISALAFQHKSLQEIKIAKCSNSSEFQILSYCENLEILRIFYADQKILKSLSTSLCKLSILEINTRQFDASNLSDVLERSGPLLQRLKLDSEFEILSQSLLLESLTNFCPNIIYLYISSIRFSTQFPKLIQGLQRLKFFTLKWIKVTTEKVGVTKNRVMRVAKLLPSTLQYLEWKTLRTNSNSHNDVLLHYCNAPLVRLLIEVNYGKKNFLQTLFEFRSRKRTLIYVYITGSDLDIDFENDLKGYMMQLTYDQIVIHC
ncbi:7898_t:CDS:1, partial [Scutellospora calospora]